MVADRLDRAGIDWLLAGGTARALLGGREPPSDIDIEVATDGIARAARELRTAAAPSVSNGMRSTRASTEVAGLAVDVSADVCVIEPSPLPSDFELQRRWARRVRVGSLSVLLAPEEELLVRAAAAGDAARVARLGRLAAVRGLRGAYVRARLARASAAS